MTTLPDRPKGAMTGTARGSKWFAWCYAVLALVSGWVYLADEWGDWVRLLITVTWIVMAVVYYRSWKILKRSEAQQ